LLYFGEYNSKTIIVCEKCKAINFLAKFIWTCPLCGVRFRGKSDLCSNNTEGFNKNFLSYKSRKKIKSENNDDNNDEQKGLRSNQSYGRRNRETLVSLLRKRNEMSLEKDKNLNRNENENKIDRNIIEKDSKTFNIKSIKYDENKENTNTNTNNLKIIQLDSIDMDKTSQYRRGLKKSLSESKSLQNTSKRNSYFGKRNAPTAGASTFHKGIDIGASYGTPIYAAASGTVSIAQYGYGGGYGNYILLDHGNGVQTLYGHCSSLAVSAGTHVNQGQVIAYVGSTGNSTGNHLHFEVRVNGVAQNPQNYVY